MALDGVFLHHLIKELDSATTARVDKIHQPSREELVFSLRKSGFNKKLYICIKSGRTRISFTESKPENPANPPMFCMLLRKYLTGAKILGFEQSGLERIVTINFSAFSEMGDEVFPRLVIELISNQTNVILCDSSGKVIDSLHRSDIEKGKRLIQPGATYCPPPAQNKANPLTNTADALVQKILANKNLPLNKAILNSIDGISPLIASELAFSAAGTADSVVADISNTQIEKLKQMLSRIFSTDFSPTPTMLIKDDGAPFDFSYLPITLYGNTYTTKSTEDLNALLDLFFTNTDNFDRIRQKSSEINRFLNNAIARISRKMQFRIMDLKKSEDREQLRIYGELIKANLHSINQGQAMARVQNYYDENLSVIEIPLNPAISPAQNAAKYFKDYKKSYTAQQTLTELIEKDKLELEYLESVRDFLNRADSIADINEINDELSSSGYINKGKNTVKTSNTATFMEYESVEGYKILVGRNNRQNDLLTLKTAGKGDMWFHTKNIPGSHVVVFCTGNPLSEETILFAAKLAAKNSKAKNSSSVAVDYTPIKYVKKPAGAKPGMVIYTTNKTVFVTPEEK